MLVKLLPLSALLLLPAAARSAFGPRYGGDLAVGVPETPSSVEPQGTAGTTAALLGGLIHETLVGVDAEGLPSPALAQGWTSAAEGREWRLTLREGATFHDGRPVTSEDALAAVRRFLRSDSPAARWLASGLEGGVAPDPRHLVLRFLEPRALPLAPLAAPAAAVTGLRGSGCGPFVPAAPRPGTRLRLTAFAGHARGRPYLDAVDVVAVAPPEALEAEYRAGRLDIFPGEGRTSSLAAMLLLVLDPSHRPFDGPEARATAAGAIDRADIVTRLLKGGDAAPSLLVPSLLPPVGTDAPARGRELSGAVVMAVGTDVPPLVSQRVVASLGAVGLRVDAKPVSPSLARNAPAAARLFLWSPEVAEAGLALNELSALVPRVAAADEALAAAAREGDLDRRRALLHRAEAALRAAHVLVPVAAVPVAFHVRGGIHGARVDLAGRLVLEDAWREP